MTLLSTATVRSDKIVFAQDFTSRRMVQDAMGTLVGCNVGLRGPGIIPTALTSRVTYDRTQSLFVNASKMTIRTKFRTGAVVPNNKYAVCKGPITFNDNQWLQIIAGGSFLQYIAASAADVANYATCDTLFLASSTYVMHMVYDGALAVGSRIIWYMNGSPAPTTIVGTIPASMRAGASPVTVFQAAGGSTNAPDTDFTLFDAKIWSVALTPAEVADEALNRTYGAP
jgi:hypothetical protein